MSKKALITLIILCAAGLVYGIHNNYLTLPLNLKQTVIHPIDKAVYMQTYPVKVWYTNIVLTEKDPFTGKVYHEKAVRIFFKNEGSDSVAFIIGGVAIVDSTGKTYYPDVMLVYYPLEIYPNAKTHIDVPFKKLPSSGWLYIDVFKANGQITEYGPTVSYKKLETIKFKYSGAV